MATMTKRGFAAATAAFLGWLGFGRSKAKAKTPAPAAEPIPAAAPTPLPEPPPPALFSEVRMGLAGAPPIVFIPGLTAPAQAWTATAERFAATHDIRILHLAGMAGAPPQPWDGRFLEAHADAIAQRLIDLDLVGAVVIGHSLGGTLAMMIAARAPLAVGKVVIVDQVPFLAQWVSAGQVQSESQAASLAERTRKSFLEADWRQGFPGIDQRLAIETRDEAFRPQVRAYILASDQRTVAEGMADLLATDLRPRLPQVRQETLVLMSYDPTLIPLPPQMILSAARMQYAGLPQGEIRLIEGARHWIMHDQREALIAAVTAFLGDQRSTQ